MRLRAWSAALTVLAALAASPAPAADVKRVVLLETATLAVIQEITSSLVSQLEHLGYRQGETLDLEIVNAEWSRERGESLLRAAIAESRPDLVVSVATLASQTARAVLRGTDIPQLFVLVSAPVEAGLVDSLDGPTGTNITGHTPRVPMAARLELAIVMLQKAEVRWPVRIGVVHSDYPSALADLADLERKAAGREDATVVPLKVGAPSDAGGVDQMTREVLARISTWTERVDVLWVAGGPMGRSGDFIAAVSAASSVPVLVTPDVKTLCRGAIFAVAVDADTQGRDAAQMAHAILGGTAAGEIPIGHPDAIRVAVNLDEAIRRGIVVPPDVLEVADIGVCTPNRRAGGRRN